MSDVSIGRCEYCGKENVPVTSTPETDIYCIDCFRLTRDNCNSAIREIKEFQKNNKIRPTKRNKTVDDYRLEAEAALSALAGQSITME